MTIVEIPEKWLLLQRPEAMNLKNLATLKEKLVAAADFPPVMDYFMTEFGDHMEFLDKGQRVDNQLLEAVLCEVGKEIFRDAPAVVLDRLTFGRNPRLSLHARRVPLERLPVDHVLFRGRANGHARGSNVD